jgi:hypothetical protein
MKLIIDKSKCRVTESLNGRAIEIETDDAVYIKDEHQDCLLFPFDGGDDLILFENSSEMKKPKDFKFFSPFITPVPKDYTL